MDSKPKHLEKSPSVRKAGYPAENEDDFLIKAGLKLNHLRLISAIAEHGQVSAAADALNISQPAASRMLHEAESILKAPLCERAAKGVIMTRFGEALARRARSILLEIREANREITELRTGYGGSVSMGSVTAPAIGLAVPAIRKVRTIYPAISINCQVETSNVLARDLIAARYDFVIGRIPDDLNPGLFRAIPLGVEKACLIVRSGHPALRRPVSTLEELSTYDWVFQPANTLLRREMELMFLQKDIPLPANVVSTSSVLLTMALVCESDAIAPIAEDVARFIASQQSRMGEIAILSTDFEIVLQPYSLITAQGRALPPSAKLLHDLILEEGQLSSDVSFA
ncbi:LysR family transcriptional regulator [Rhizobium sp. KVB221]|uniref:LysR family transcriptional regulator n=1 Tax=Rhizobium setariae TaxID=2801340 RepID=A0A936YTI8_9HYPH|nr:LysR family transcriptional regulator [Rhizobium setariae]MBL0374636.1 LysR family transcriptional regulator [Rhizobium setariae]